MKYRKMGNTSWEASAIALGIMRMSTLSTADAAKTIEAAVGAGVNYIDSADMYGEGASERVFGEALKQTNVKRDDLFIQSKGGIVVDPKRSHDGLVFGQRYDFSKQHLIESVDGILQRMNIDYLDAFLLHRPDPLMAPDEIAEAFDILQRDGKVRHFGVSNFNVEQYRFLQSHLDQKLMINQLQFSIMHTGMVDSGMHTNMADDRSVDHDGGMLEFARANDITIQAWSPFQYGMFEGTFINNDKFPELNAKLQELADKYHVGLNAIAAAWILRHPANMQVILGTMNPDHITDGASGADVELTKQDWYDVYFAAGNDLP